MADGSSSSTNGSGPDRTLTTRRVATAAFAFVAGVGSVALGLVLLDGAMGRFSLILVPGEGSAPIEAGTYVITRGPRARGGPAPTLEVLGPDGHRVPVEEVSGDTFGGAAHPVAVFHATTAGSHTIRASASEKGSIDSVAVERILDGTGDVPIGAFSALGVGSLAVVLSAGYLIVGVSRSTRASRLASLPPPPRGMA